MTSHVYVSGAPPVPYTHTVSLEVLESHPALSKKLKTAGFPNAVSCDELVPWNELEGCAAFNRTGKTGKGGLSWNCVLKLFLIVSILIYDDILNLNPKTHTTYYHFTK